MKKVFFIDSDDGTAEIAWKITTLLYYFFPLKWKDYDEKENKMSCVWRRSRTG